MYAQSDGKFCVLVIMQKGREQRVSRDRIADEEVMRNVDDEDGWRSCESHEYEREDRICKDVK